MARVIPQRDSWWRENEMGRVTIHGLLKVIFDPGETCTQAQAEIEVVDAGYAFNSAPQTDLGVAWLRVIRARRNKDAFNIFDVDLEYRTWDDRRAINDERIQVGWHEESMTQYCNPAGAFKDLSPGQHGFPVTVCKASIHVHRVHTITVVQTASISVATGKLAAADFTTTGGVPLGGGGTLKLKFCGCDSRQLDKNKFDLSYTFERDFAWVNLPDGVGQWRNFGLVVPTENSNNGHLVDLEVKPAIPTADFSTLMANE